jgi:hypothetical protein
MLGFTPPHRVLSRQVSRLASNHPLISPPNASNYLPAVFAPLHPFRRTYATPSASPSPASSPTVGLKWNRRLRRLGIVTLVGAGALWWDAEYNARTLSRNFRTIWHGAVIAFDYKCVLPLFKYFHGPLGVLVGAHPPQGRGLDVLSLSRSMQRSAHQKDTDKEIFIDSTLIPMIWIASMVCTSALLLGY